MAQQSQEERVRQMMETKPVKTDSVMMGLTSMRTSGKTDQLRRMIINKIKESLVVKFQEQVALLHTKKQFETNYTDEDFIKDMGELIKYFQGKLDELKVDGKFYPKTSMATLEEECEDCANDPCMCDAIEPCYNCNTGMKLEDGEQEECEYCNQLFCEDCITHTDNDQYLCDKCL